MISQTGYKKVKGNSFLPIWKTCKIIKAGFNNLMLGSKIHSMHYVPARAKIIQDNSHNRETLELHVNGHGGHTLQ